MDITFEQARAFEATARLGTIQKAAKELNKGHSAILYLIRSLESQTGFALFDRTGYRNQLSAPGNVVLKYCRDLLTMKGELAVTCSRLKGGWEPSIRLIYDGVVDFNLIADAFLSMSQNEAPTEVQIQAAYLREVEQEFASGKFDLMVTILPIQIPGVVAVALKPIEMLLVAHSRHPINLNSKRTRMSLDDLTHHSQIVVRDSAGQLGLSTEGAEFNSTIQVNDFPTKKEAILRGLGFGWLPEYIIRKELSEGRLKILKTVLKSKFRFHPKLYHKQTQLIGRGVTSIIEHLKKT